MIYQIDYHAFCAYIGPKRLLSGRQIAKGFISETNCTQDYLKRSRSNPWFKDSTDLVSCMKFLGEIHTEGIPILGQSNWQPQLYSMWNFHTREPEDKSWQRLVFPDLTKYWEEISKQFAKDIDKIYLMGPTPESSAVITGIDLNEKRFNFESRYFSNLDKMMKEMKGEMTKGDVISQNLTEIARDIKALISSNEQYEKDNYRLKAELNTLKQEVAALKIDNNSLTGSRDYWKLAYMDASKGRTVTHVCNCKNETPEDPFVANRQNNPFWVDREGVKQHIQSLDDKHLLNIFNVLNNEARYGEHPPKMKYVLNEFKRRGIHVQKG